MTYMTKISTSVLALAAGVVMLGSAGSVPVQAQTIYYGETVTLREARRMCDGIHGRVFLSSRDVYACRNDRSNRRKAVTPLPPPGDEVPQVFTVKKANSSGKRQNFTGSKTFPGMIGHQGGGGEGGGGGNGGSAGGPN